MRIIDYLFMMLYGFVVSSNLYTGLKYLEREDPQTAWIFFAISILFLVVGVWIAWINYQLVQRELVSLEVKVAAEGFDVEEWKPRFGKAFRLFPWSKPVTL